jgi:hypothetical protein
MDLYLVHNARIFYVMEILDYQRLKKKRKKKQMDV